MPVEREFLGWDGPCLPRAARWLLDRFGSDLGGVIAVTPGGRAGRRLLELLVELSAGQPLAPPTITTAGALPEHLYESGASVAGELPALLARVAALQSMNRDRLAAVVPHPPQKDDLAGWIALAQDINQLHDQLAGELLRFDQVAARAAQLPDFADEPRWQALASAQQAYEQLLRNQGMIDPHGARFDAVENNRCAADGPVVLIAAGDLNGVNRAMLRQVSDRVTTLIHAPESHADGFDELGCINVEYWHDRPLNIDANCVDVVDRPRDQAVAALRTIAANSDRGADQITIGLGDETLGPLIERTLGLANLPARAAIGRPVAQSGAAMLLAALSRYAQRNRLDDFAAVARHPDMHPLLGDDPIDLTAIDMYANRHLQAEIAERWLTRGEDATRELNRLHETVRELLPADDKPMLLSQCSEPIAELLRRVYGDREMFDEKSLETLGDLLREQAMLDDEASFNPRVTLAEAIQLMLSRLVGRFTTPEGGAPAIELLGWLELQLDDAPVLIVTGVNEGKLPRSVAHDALLPDRLRGVLGMADSRRIFARDRMMLEAIMHSRDVVQLVTGRRGADNDPLTPSRLLLACDEADLPRRVTAFYGHDEQPAPAPLLIKPGKSAFVIPVPKPPAKPIDRLPVTAFADYIACPYRFYLKHVLRLNSMNDRAVEMDALAFGGLAHDVLETFGQSEARDLTDADDIEQFLASQLDKQVRRRFGSQPRTAVLIQQQLLRHRLAALARWQAQQRADGWRIVHVEQKLDAVIDVDDAAFTIHGRIDRIDAHDELGWRILDYKTGDTARQPDRTHRRKDENGDDMWSDLQLPLYRTLARELVKGADAQLGYINLPKTLGDTGLAPAGWSDEQINDALGAAVDIIRAVRDGVFWAPGEPPRYADGLEGICMDASPDRENIIGSISP